jgi:hypothetical protein
MTRRLRTARLRLALLAAAAPLAAACTPAPGADAASTEAARRALADTLLRGIAAAYDPARPDVVARSMALYVDSGPVVSAAAGRITADRAALERDVRRFWESVGRNMREPRWEWGERHLERLGPDAAALTASYRVPHRTPAGVPHVIGGVWTAVFVRRGGRWAIVQEHLSDAPQVLGAPAAAAVDGAAHRH